MSHSELKTLVLEEMKAQALANKSYQEEIKKTLTELSTRQTESERQLQHLSELYTHLVPLIETLNSTVKNDFR